MGEYPRNKLLAGHLLRRAGFGPSPRELKNITEKGRESWIDQQLHPEKIDDSDVEPLLPAPNPDPIWDWERIRRWYVRMTFSRRQLLEKMTLIWHEHFALSNLKIHHAVLAQEYEDLLRSQALGNFRNFLAAMTTNQAMLLWLDNNENDGNSLSPPNENFARELLQLFTTGTRQLRLDGSIVTDLAGNPVPAYTEQDIKEIARALTGFWTHNPRVAGSSEFSSYKHDGEPKTFLGTTIPGRYGAEGALEVNDVINVILTQRRDTVAAFISGILIGKLATETPTPGYVQDVARAFAESDWDIKVVVRAILTHPEFNSPAVVRTQVREPLEQFVGAVRALSAVTGGEKIFLWAWLSGQPAWYPPSVFSFYPPGQKRMLLDTASVMFRDLGADEYTRGYEDTRFDPAELISRYRMRTPERAVDALSDVLLSAPLQEEVRTEVIAYMRGQVTDDTVRGAIWLILCSPDYQRN